MSNAGGDARRGAAVEQEPRYWSTAYEPIMRLDPGFCEQVERLVSHPWRSGPLEPRVKQLVLMAVDAAATHRNADGAKEHARRALELGATRDEVLEVLELTSTVGIHACNCGVPILLEELAHAGSPVDLEGPLTTRQQEIKAEFAAARGYWNEFWDGLLRLDPEFFAAYSDFSAHPWRYGTLAPKIRELIYTAFDASATHMYEPGLRQHIRNALALGATGPEVMEVLELASGIGVEAFALAAPALVDEAGSPTGGVSACP
jgi:alkylhydroperoxidase/carboxymuconolactone decarboxylase family protein YurZ